MSTIQHDAIARLRTDRRVFGEDQVRAESLTALKSAAEAEGMWVHHIPLSQMPMLAIAVARAGAREMTDPAYVTELIRWTNRPAWSQDGIPATTAVKRAPRRVPVRELAVAPREGLPIEPGGDRGAAYLVLYGDGQEPHDWLRAGEALSSVLLTAVSLGLSVAPISDVIEVDDSRELVRGLLNGPGHPYVVIRIGKGPSASDLEEAPRRSPTDVIDRLDLW
jgi:hypothetical protein